MYAEKGTKKNSFLVRFCLMFSLRVTYKDKLKLLKYDEFKVKVFCLEYKETYGINFVGNPTVEQSKLSSYFC